jgi:site-specific DNA recombinase
MQSTNGHGRKRAILYARVSTEEQAKSGYSLAQQIEALRAYAAREGYEVLEEVRDPGQSGASLERPGMDQVRDLVAAGGVSIVLAQDRDRFAREPAYHYLLRREFEEYGCKIRALNDRGDDSPEGELTDGILDQLAKFERAKTAERSRRGKLRKAREGKVLASRTPDYGFRYNASRDNYVVDEETMQIVRRIFRMVGVEGATAHMVKRTLEREEIPTPGGGKYWDRPFFRECILDDVYKPHTREEIESLVAEELISPDVAAALDPHKTCGIWWFNRRRCTRTRIVSTGVDGQREYRWRQRIEEKPREEWVGVPVPNAGIPREHVEAARAVVKNNRKPSSAGHRVWTLSAGLLRCGGCGRSMTSARSRSTPKHDYRSYYRCHGRSDKGAEACPRVKGERAEEIEAFAWNFVRDLLLDPEQLRVDLDAAIELERGAANHGDPKREAKVWLDKIADTDRQRSRAQNLAVEGLLSHDELRAKLASLEETRETARRELALLEDRREKIAELEADRDTLLDHLERVAPEELDALTPEERHQVYKVLGLRVIAREDGNHEASIAYTLDHETPPGVCNTEVVYACCL